MPNKVRDAPETSPARKGYASGIWGRVVHRPAAARLPETNQLNRSEVNLLMSDLPLLSLMIGEYFRLISAERDFKNA